jgi:hypothetical protein
MKPDSKRLCPRCGSSEVFRSHRHGTVERYLLRAIGVRPFRCVNCDGRFYRLKQSDGSESQFFSLAKNRSGPGLIATMASIAAASRAIVNYIPGGALVAHWVISFDEALGSNGLPIELTH